MFNNPYIQGLLSQLLMSRFGQGQQVGPSGQFSPMGLLGQSQGQGQNIGQTPPQLQMFNPTQQLSAPLPGQPPTPHPPFQMPPQPRSAIG